MPSGNSYLSAVPTEQSTALGVPSLMQLMGQQPDSNTLMQLMSQSIASLVQTVEPSTSHQIAPFPTTTACSVTESLITVIPTTRASAIATIPCLDSSIGATKNGLPRIQRFQRPRKILVNNANNNNPKIQKN